MRFRSRVITVVVGLQFAIPGAAVAGAMDPADYTASITNPWFPLKPGVTLSYRGIKDDKRADRVLTVTDKTKVIDGVTCVVVEDLVTMGSASDRTVGYYAQDRGGAVWYFGEDVQELDAKGHPTKSEGWHVGVDGASPSLVMEATPSVGHTFAHAYTNDHWAVVSLSKSVKVPFGSFKDALVIKEWTPDEPDVLNHKYFVRGLGEVRDVAVKGDREEFVLVKVAR